MSGKQEDKNDLASTSQLCDQGDSPEEGEEETTQSRTTHVFKSLIKNIKWWESKNRGGYNTKAFETWKSKNPWELLDDKLEFLNLGKIIRNHIDSNQIGGIDLSSVKMSRIHTWYEDMYGITLDDEETDDETSPEDEVFHDSIEENGLADRSNLAESTHVGIQGSSNLTKNEVTVTNKPKPISPTSKIVQNHSDQNTIGLNDLAQLLQISNSVMPNIEPLRTAKDDAKEWFDHFEMITSSYGWNEATKGLKLPVFLKKDAQRIFKQIPVETRQDYQQVKKIICNELMEEERTLMRSSFLNIVQKQGESPADYGYRLKKFINKLDITFKKPDLIAQFIAGLRPELRLAVMGNNSNSLDEATRYSQKVGQVIAETHRSEEIHSVSRVFQRQPTEKEPTYSNNNVVCFHCAETGHIKADCSIYKKAMSLVTCKKCNKKGHYAKKCKVGSNGKAPISRDQVRCPQ